MHFSAHLHTSTRFVLGRQEEGLYSVCTQEKDVSSTTYSLMTCVKYYKVHHRLYTCTVYTSVDTIFVCTNVIVHIRTYVHTYAYFEGVNFHLLLNPTKDGSILADMYVCFQNNHQK